jgi:hypothetical protein
MEDVLQAYKRVEHLIEAQDPNDLTAQNVDVVAASSLILGVADNILTYRDRIEKLPEFDIRHVDFLKDLAKALWFLFVTNLPVGVRSCARSWSSTRYTGSCLHTRRTLRPAGRSCP